jgi:hypothetical protein
LFLTQAKQCSCAENAMRILDLLGPYHNSVTNEVNPRSNF